MKVVVQRVRSSRVEVQGKAIGSIGKGLNILVGIAKGDTEAEIEWMAQKCLNLRVFPEDASDMAKQRLSQSIQDIQGDILAISQFTLYGDCRKGRRPSFDQSANPSTAEQLYQYFISCLRKSGLTVETGEFGASMQVFIENDGPVTLVIERDPPV
ncbi:MAG: D-aminoacyl-tRNA deacylase [Cyanobacteria bacterium P01_F01_bin.150]